MASPYPANVSDESGEVRISGEIDFTDPANQPAGGFLGWSSDAADPANVNSNGGALTVNTATAGGFFMSSPPAITGALSTITDPAAKAVLTSIIHLLTAANGLATNGTT